MASIKNIAIIAHVDHGKTTLVDKIMAFVALVSLVPTIYRATFDSDEWLTQPDAIVETKFNTFPNIYIIQPDGYVNFSELAKDPYNFENGEFEAHLEDKNFKLYKNFRSNYTSTVLSNSSMFGMKHHYKGEQLFGARKVIAGNNPVIETLKNNKYQTFLFMAHCARSFIALLLLVLIFRKSLFGKIDAEIV